MMPVEAALPIQTVPMPIKQGIPRSIEIAAAALGLAVTAPLLALSAAAIKVTSPGPVLFRQQRVGRKGRMFTLYKFRTMQAVQKGGPTGVQVTASDDARITKVGRILRKTKLDEFPELWNILKGDMSLVGPRPEVPRYVDMDNVLWRLVLEARPGLTDPVTLRLRNEESLLSQVPGDREQFYRELLQPYKLRGYLEYLQQRSWQTDVSVLVKTGLAVLLPHQAPPPTVQEIMLHAQANLKA